MIVTIVNSTQYLQACNPVTELIIAVGVSVLFAMFIVAVLRPDVNWLIIQMELFTIWHQCFWWLKEVLAALPPLLTVKNNDL